MLYICINLALALPVSLARLWRTWLLSSSSVFSILYHTYLRPLTSCTVGNMLQFFTSLDICTLKFSFPFWLPLPTIVFFLGWGKKTPIFSSVPHTFKNYLLEIVLDLAKRIDLSSLNARTNSMKFLAFVLYTTLEFDFCLSLSASLDFEIKSYLFSHFAFFPVPSTGPTTQEMHWKSLLNSTWYLMDKDLQFQVQADLQAISIILKTISIPLKQFSHRTNEIYFGDQ